MAVFPFTPVGFRWNPYSCKWWLALSDAVNAYSF